MLDFLLWFTFGTILCYILDYLSEYLYYMFSINDVVFSQNTRWFFIHFVINCVVAYYGIFDLLYCVTNISQCAITQWLYGYMVYGLAISLHFYHILAFKLTPTDWLHHIMTAVISGPIMLLYSTTSSAVFALWFMSGFPGAIDYLLLWLVKMGYVSPEIEKKVYVALSVWLRAPGCLLAVAFELGAFVNISSMDYDKIIALLWIIFITYWNGLYFMQITLESYYSQRGNLLVTN
jgi:hypothetical protein